MSKIFADRKEAGEALAGSLKEYKKNELVIVIAIPRGGIEIGVPIAKELDAPLDVFVTRKIGAPDNEEFAIGALSETGEIFLNQESAGIYNREEVKKVINEELKEADERVKKYRGHKLPSLKGKIVLLVDDGLATGSTMLVAARAIKEQKPKKLVVAIPVAPPDSVKKVKEVADEVIALEVTRMFFAVGQFYHNFSQTTDDDVERLMKEYKKSRGES